MKVSLHPPGPKPRLLGFPLLGQMYRDYLGFATRMHAQYGDIYRMHLPFERAYSIASPELVRQLLIDHAEHVIRWERGVDVFAEVFGRSVLTTEGATWQRQRRMLHGAFTPKRVVGYAQLMQDSAQQAFDALIPHGSAATQVDMGSLFATLTMNVICATLFGHPSPNHAQSVIWATRVLSKVALQDMFLPFGLPDFLPLPGNVVKRRAKRLLKGFVAQSIAQRRANPEPGHDLLSELFQARDPETLAALSDSEIFDQCMVTFQAGHETSATALLWWSHLLATHPHEAGLVQQEVDQILAGRVPGPEDMQKLPYLLATLKEAMRLYPPLATLMTRRTTAPIELGGWQIPARSMVYVTPWLLHRDPRSFPEPDRFKPERFLPDGPAHPRAAWIPFGIGPRVCLGQHFAMLEMLIVAAMLLQRFEIHADSKTTIQPELHITLRPNDAVCLTLVRR